VGVPDYRRAATAGIHPNFIAGLARLVRRAADGETPLCSDGGKH
jgi:hypothetical protein